MLKGMENHGKNKSHDISVVNIHFCTSGQCYFFLFKSLSSHHKQLEKSWEIFS